MASVQINSNQNYSIGKIINQELRNSQHTQIAVAFLKESGIRVIEDSLLFSLSNNGAFEIIAGLDFKTTDPFAIKHFLDLKKSYKNLNIYCYGNHELAKPTTVFHPKIYLFKNNKENTSIIGSSNLTAGGLMTNFEVSTIFVEKEPVYFSQLQAIYNSIKYTSSIFIPDEEFLLKYSDVYKALSNNDIKVNKDKGLQKAIKDIVDKQETLPGTVPTLNTLIINALKHYKSKGVTDVRLKQIYEHIENKLSEPELANVYKMDTLHNTIRGEINHNEYSNLSERSKRLYIRTGSGVYKLSEFGESYKGR